MKKQVKMIKLIIMRFQSVTKVSFKANKELWSALGNPEIGSALDYIETLNSLKLP